MELGRESSILEIKLNLPQNMITKCLTLNQCVIWYLGEPPEGELKPFGVETQPKNGIGAMNEMPAAKTVLSFWGVNRVSAIYGAHIINIGNVGNFPRSTTSSTHGNPGRPNPIL